MDGQAISSLLSGAGNLAANALGGPAGGAAFSVAKGMFDHLIANHKKNQAQSAFPQMVDPQQAAFLAELAQKRKSIDTGADFAEGMNTVNEGTAGTQNAITKSTGGDVGGTIQGLIQAQRAGDNGRNQIFATGQQQQAQYTGLYGNVLKNMVDAKRQLQLLRYSQNMADSAQKQTASNYNTNAGLASLMGGMGGSHPSGIGDASKTPPPPDDTGTLDFGDIFSKMNPGAAITMDSNQTQGMPNVTPGIGDAANEIAPALASGAFGF